MMPPILTAAEMRAAEEAAIAAGTPVETLMERAGLAAAEAIWRFAGPLPALILCGPGNNGGDGYVVARALSERGLDVRVAALGEPKTGAALNARQLWTGPVVPLADAAATPLLIDALFGTGLGRPLDREVADRLAALAASATVRVAIDLPSGVATDDGSILSEVPDFDLTVTFQTLKPSHRLQPAARHMGRIVVADIGIEATGDLADIGQPSLAVPRPDSHKYSRGLVAILAASMPGASALAAGAAARAGAGAVRLLSAAPIDNVPASVIQAPGDALVGLDDNRIGALLLGPGLADDAESRRLLDAVLATPHRLILDAGALRLIGALGIKRLAARAETPILTPHEGEFRMLFGEGEGSKLQRARDAAARAGAVIIYKGADTVVAAPDGHAAIGPPAPAWLASAGTGDVLAGVAAAMRAGGMEAFEAACAAVWLHGRAATLAGPWLIADDLLESLPTALSECL